MTSFSALFRQMFVQKRRYAHLVLLVQTFAVIFIFLMDLITSNNFAKGYWCLVKVHILGFGMLFWP